jgi:hypothetical protein
MASVFPSSIKTFTVKTDGVDDVQADHINDLQNEVTAIETELLPLLGGWLQETVAWVRTGNTTFTRAGATSDIFPVGAKLRWKENGGAYRYAYAVGLAGTTITTAGDTLTDGATISDRGICYMEPAPGHPQWFYYTPEWTASGAPSIGDGSLTGKFCILGRTVKVAAMLTVGTTTNTGSGQWFFSLPVTPGSNFTMFVGSWRANDAGVANYGGSVLTASSSRMSLVNNGSTYVQSTAPATWGSGDTIAMSLDYGL